MCKTCFVLVNVPTILQGDNQKMSIRNKATRKFENKPKKLEQLLEVNMGRIFHRLWKSILTSNLHTKDKAEILRLLIFAFTVIFITALFVLNRF